MSLLDPMKSRLTRDLEPILVDAPDGTNPGFYYSILMAGKDSPVKTVQDIKGQDFTFVDPASTSGNLFPRVMLLDEGIDPAGQSPADLGGEDRVGAHGGVWPVLLCGAGRDDHLRTPLNVLADLPGGAFGQESRTILHPVTSSARASATRPCPMSASARKR